LLLLRSEDGRQKCDEITKLEVDLHSTDVVVLPLAKRQTPETAPVSDQVFASDFATRSPDSDDAARNGPSPVQQDSIAFFDQLRTNHRLHRYPKLHRTTLCVTGPRNQ
jgi:hypothetical protein